jgi:hypothetical protein
MQWHLRALAAFIGTTPCHCLKQLINVLREHVLLCILLWDKT